RDVVSGASALRCQVRGDFGGVGNFVGVGSPAASLFANRFARDVARADDHGENELVRAILVFERLQIADGDGDLFAGQDVGYRLREDVRTLLVEESGDVSGLLGLLVDGSGLFAFSDDSAHGARANLDGH